MQRRTFFQSTGAAAGMLSAAEMAATTGEIPARVLGKTGARVTIIGPAGGRFPLAGYEEAKAVTRRAYELGITYYDNARLYWNGRSEEAMGEALHDVRKKVFITSKSAKYTKAGAEADLAASLKALRTDYIDLWQVHQVGKMSEVEEIFGPNGSLEVFVKAKKAGQCRFIGFTGHHDPEVHLEMLKRFQDWDTILMPLNAADPGYLSFEKSVLPVAVQRGMGIQGMKSTANAKLLQSMSLKDCLSYTLSLPVHTLALGATTIGQIEDDVRIAKSFQPLKEAEMTALRKRADRLKGPALEDWKRNTATAEAPHYRDGMLHLAD
jgi:predicted aldo/keto reductase-like oxidoreductase